MHILKRNTGTGLASACVTKPELIRDLPYLADSAADENFKQQLETCRLKADPVNAATTNHEETGHGVAGVDFLFVDERFSHIWRGH